MEAESQELELDLSNMGAVNTMFAAIFSKLGVPIKTAVPATVLEEALNGMVTISPLPLGQSISKKVEKHSAHFYSVTITEEEAQNGFVCRAHSCDKSKFKLLYFDHDDAGGLTLVLQEDSAKTGKITSAGMYFLGFTVYRFDETTNPVATVRDQDATFFKKLDGFQPCEVTELKAGIHVFAVYGDNFFRGANYTIEVVCVPPFADEKENLRAVEAQILQKRTDLSKFENEYKEVLAQFKEMTGRYAREMQVIDELLKQRDDIRASYSVILPLKKKSSRIKVRGVNKEPRDGRGDKKKDPQNNKVVDKESRHSRGVDNDPQDAKGINKGSQDGTRLAKDKSHVGERSKKKKWYKIHLKAEKRNTC